MGFNKRNMNEEITYKSIPAMTPTVVHDYLTKIGSEWTGKGVAIELGSWLGATAVPLLTGLITAGYDKPFYAFDRWQANEPEVEKAKRQGVNVYVGEDLLPLFYKNTSKVYDQMKCHKGSISLNLKQYPGDPIEICLFDAPKQDPVFSDAIQALSPHWIPGVTILGLLDYYFYKKRPARREEILVQKRYIEQNAGCFELIADWPDQCSCAFFKVKKIP